MRPPKTAEEFRAAVDETLKGRDEEALSLPA